MRSKAVETTVLLILSAILLTSCTPEVIPDLSHLVGPPVEVERLQLGIDQDGDGIDDLQDLVLGARAEVERRPRYRSEYYAGGYPPEDEGVCTDLIWRALRDAGYNLKEMVDADIQERPDAYPRVDDTPDPNIDFRRVANLIPFFQKHAMELTTNIRPGDVDNLKQWQGGDIVVFDRPYAHIGIVSDKRRRDGVPLLIHNGGPYPKEEDKLLTWPSELIYHFRFPER